MNPQEQIEFLLYELAAKAVSLPPGIELRRYGNRFSMTDGLKVVHKQLPTADELVDCMHTAVVAAALREFPECFNGCQKLGTLEALAVITKALSEAADEDDL